MNPFSSARQGELRYVGMIVVALVMCHVDAAHAGKIQQTRETTSSGGSSSRNSHDDDNDDDDDNDGGSFVAALLGAIFRRSDDSESSSGVSSSYVSRETAYYSYPYEANQPGIAVITTKRYSAYHQLLSTRVSPARTNPYSGKSFTGTWQGDYNYDWDNVHISTVRARFISDRVVGVDLKWSGLFEPLDKGGADTAHMAEISLTFNRAFAPNFLGRFGLGGHIMAFPGQKPHVVGGGTGLLGVDYFPLRPMVFSAEFQMGYLNEALYIRGDGTIGVMLHGPLEFNIGYRGQSFINVNASNKVTYHGFTAGLRFWF